MRLLYLLFFLLGTGPLLRAQVNIGANFVSGGKLEAGNLDLLRASTLVFFLREGEERDAEAYRKALAATWKVCRTEVRPFRDFLHLQDKPGYSFLLITPRYDRFSNSSQGSYARDVGYLALQLWMNKPNKKGEQEKVYFCRIELARDLATDLLVKQIESEESPFYEPFYSLATVYNLNPGFLQTYLGFINAYVEQGKMHDIFEEHADPQALKALMTDTLVLPDYLFFGLDKSRYPNAAALVGDYPYPYRVAGTEQLGRRIMNGEGLYYLVVTECYNRVTFSIYHSSSRQLVYSRTNVAQKLSSRDFKDLARSMAKLRAGNG